MLNAGMTVGERRARLVSEVYRHFGLTKPIGLGLELHYPVLFRGRLRQLLCQVKGELEAQVSASTNTSQNRPNKEYLVATFFGCLQMIEPGSSL